jgi:hypothetical protein
MIDFFKLHTDLMQTSGFWSDAYKSNICFAYELTYATEVIREWCVSDIIPHGDKFLVKWQKRHTPLTDDILREKYNRTDF